MTAATTAAVTPRAANSVAAPCVIPATRIAVPALVNLLPTELSAAKAPATATTRRNAQAMLLAALPMNTPMTVKTAVTGWSVLEVNAPLVTSNARTLSVRWELPTTPGHAQPRTHCAKLPALCLIVVVAVFYTIKISLMARLVAPTVVVRTAPAKATQLSVRLATGSIVTKISGFPSLLFSAAFSSSPSCPAFGVHAVVADVQQRVQRLHHRPRLRK